MSFVLLGILNSQAGAGGNIPASLNPDLWLDASDASTITASGGSVSQWDNKGSLANFTQATSADQPTTGVNTLNGLNVVDFDLDFLTSTSATDYNFMHNGTQYITAAVWKLGNTSNPNAFMVYTGSVGASGGDVGVRISVDDRDPTNMRKFVDIGRGVPSTTVFSVADTGFFDPANTFFIESQLIDPDNATTADRIDYFKNSTQGTATVSSSGDPTTANSTNPLQIGASGDDSFPLKGALAELVVVSGADATETNRQELVNYLNAKWSVF